MVEASCVSMRIQMLNSGMIRGEVFLCFTRCFCYYYPNYRAGFIRLITIKQRHQRQMADISVKPDESDNDATDTVAGR